ncbi:unannotated protein [freshwater metagenome]|uniref:Unannotated protein n=1 Tax=freshwater metagenome TaxID=449393 RepID=A0A6J6NX53_9ZZZZ
MQRCINLTMPTHGIDHPGERLCGWLIAVQHHERFAVVRPNTYLKANLARIRIGDHAAHLEPADFAGKHAVLDHRLGATLLDD